ncbi:MAG: bile acid:sodium symporter family protein [Synechococcaceae cyanobacterium]|nr:bile acid:sodium symporter family protein [Synechococcaceae cyanobacterium]
MPEGPSRARRSPAARSKATLPPRACRSGAGAAGSPASRHGPSMFEIALPLALAFIMVSLGITLTPADFGFALTRPRPLLAGILSQVVLLPIVAWILIGAFGLGGPLAVGVMVLACCPGGITSNVMTRLARGDVALSISYTALASLLTMVTLPLIVSLTAGLLLGETGTRVDVTGLSLKVFLMSTLPVVLGVLARLRWPLAVRGLEAPLAQVANGLFALILAITIVSQWHTLVANLDRLGPVLLALNLSMLAIGTAVGHLLALPPPQVSTLAIESGFQNGTVGIAVGALLAGAAHQESLSAYSLPSGVYGVLMMVTIAPYLLWRRSLPRVATVSGTASPHRRGRRPRGRRRSGRRGRCSRDSG